MITNKKQTAAAIRAAVDQAAKLEKFQQEKKEIKLEMKRNLIC